MVPSALIDLSAVGPAIDWEVAPSQLLAGDLSGVDPQLTRLIQRAAAIPEVATLARQLNIDAVRLVIGLLARAQSATSRSAARIAKAILGASSLAELDILSVRFGLEIGHLSSKAP
jgi:hypothetical protein